MSGVECDSGIIPSFGWRAPHVAAAESGFPVVRANGKPIISTREREQSCVKILLVEDDTEVADFVERALRDFGYEVTAVQDGSEAMALASSEEWDLFIVDRMLPGIDGVQIVTNLRTMGVSVPVLFLTTLGEIDHRMSGLNAGVHDWLAKPFAYGELIARVAALGPRSGNTMP